MSAVANAIGVSRQHLSAMRQRKERRRRGRPPLPDAELVADIRALILELPTYGYRRVHALLRRQAEEDGRAAPNPKRVYRVMKLHGLLLQRHSGRGEERRHDGRIAVDTRNTRWCSDGLEIGCDNGEKVRVAFALDGQVNRLPKTIEWLTDNGSCYTLICCQESNRDGVDRDA